MIGQYCMGSSVGEKLKRKYERSEMAEKRLAVSRTCWEQSCN